MEVRFGPLPALCWREKTAARQIAVVKQQMLAIGRALMARPETHAPWMNLYGLGRPPLLVKEISEIIKEINQRGTTILLVEQKCPYGIHHSP